MPCSILKSGYNCAPEMSKRMTQSADTVWNFPCAFPLKVFGRNSAEFETLVVEIVRRHAPDLEDSAVSSRTSGGDAYRSVTATFTAHSREQLDALYLELSQHEQVLMLL
jgi:putative lipoic acid-binding regulatory protein